MDSPTLCPRTRLVAALTLAFGIAALQGLAVLPVLALLVAATVLTLGQGRQVIARGRGALVLALSLVLLLPLMAGETPLLHLGPLALHREGLGAGVLMATRLLALVALTLALLGPLAPAQLVAGLRGLGLPALMADLALLTLRYLSEFRDDLRRAHLARRLRGGRTGARALPDHALLLATALIRANARAERVWAAMRLRGHATGLAAPCTPLQARDRAMMTGALVLSLALITLDRTL